MPRNLIYYVKHNYLQCANENVVYIIYKLIAVRNILLNIPTKTINCYVESTCKWSSFLKDHRRFSNHN